MARKTVSVAQLADEADVDFDEALVMLWEAGLDDLTDPTDRIPARFVGVAKRALNLPTARQLGSIPYLAGAAGLTVEGAREKLLDAGVISERTGDRLPRGMLRKARRVLNLTAPQIAASAPEIERQLVDKEKSRPFVWSVVGQEEDFGLLTVEEIEKIHFALARDFARSGDPIAPAGVRDQNLLESAVQRPLTSLGDHRKYPTVPMAGAALFHSLALNHAFFNGNKRTALVALLVFLDRNKYVLEVREADLFKYVLLVAQHRVVRDGSSRPDSDEEVHAIARWICENMRKVRKDELPMRWRDLKRILINYDCELQVLTGNRMNIERVIPKRRFFGGQKVLKTQVFYGDEGREADPNTIHKIRRDLQLDEEHGVDSEVFYRGREVIDVFIARYRKTLERLARL